MPEPVDDKLYEQTKQEVYKQIPKHSAYRSGILVQKYKEKFKKKYGNKSPYRGKKTDKKGIARWFKEEWVNQRGEIGYKNKNDIYRPSKRITKDTPITHGELTKKEIKISKLIAKQLKKEKIFFSGIDFIDQKLNGDINVTSPTGLKTLFDLSKINLATTFWKELKA